MIYYLYSPRQTGWFTKTSQYSSDIKEARAFDRDEALTMCKSHKERGSYNLIPVRSEDIQAI